MKLIRFFNIAGLTFLLTFSCWAQVSDDFSDGDFTTNPQWSGSTTSFIVDNEVLRSNVDPGDDAINYFLSTENSLIDDVQWEFWINLDFATSGANYADVYLMSDNADLSAAANGYFIRFGDTEDEISFYKLSSGSESILIDGPDGELGSSNNIYKVRITRTTVGLWTLELDEDNTGVFIGAGSITDSSISTTSHFGIRIEQSSAASPVNNHFFDDFEIGPIPVDEEAPELISVTAASATELVLQFSEALEEASASNVTNYSIDGGIGNPVTAFLDGGSSNTVNLTLSPALTNGQDYTVTVSGVADLAGNAATDETATFTFFIPDDPNPGDVIFNEIFPDPSPSVGLPEFEYVEIYNRSTNFFDTEDWILVNSAVERVLSSISFPPDTYLILCDAENVDAFSSFGTVIGINSFTTLANSSDSLTLLDGSGEVLDIVSYTDNWYQDPDKDDGGYSLERINPIISCSGASNWAASNDPLGGTPGSQNSLFDDTPDTTPPSVTSVSVIDPLNVLIVVSEPLEDLNSTSISFDPGISINEISLVQDDQIQVLLVDPLQTGVDYEVTVTGLVDCEGNVSGTEIISIFLGEIPLPGDLIISEIMADPTPAVGLPAGEYFELFNMSNKTLELQGSELSGVIIEESITMPPGEYLAFASISNEQVFANLSGFGFLDMSVTFLTNGGRELTLTNSEGEQLDFVEYSDDWYDDADKDDGGYSLELINPDLACSGAFNWSASDDPLGGTPGAQNSIFDDTPDLTPPTILNVIVSNPTTLLISLSEPLDENGLSGATVELDQGISVSEFFLVESDTILASLADPLETGVSYTLSVSGLSDCEGNTSSLETTEIFIGELPLPGDLIISEIMADPTPAVGLPEGEYFELFNKSNKTLELQGSELSGVLFEESVIMQPGEYLAFASDSNEEIFENIGGIRFLSMSTSFLTNGGTELDLVNSEGEQLDFVDYSDDWYNDSDKDDGGYSLELINPDAACSGAFNWSASDSPLGGTPGEQNSIFNDAPDQSAPTLVSFGIPQDNEVQLQFSEPLDEESINDIVATFTPESAIAGIFQTQPDELLIELILPLEIGITYSVQLIGVADCAGNQAPAIELNILLGVMPEVNQILITEIMADPSPSVGLPEGEYFELYNASDVAIDLLDCSLSGVEFEQSIVMAPGEYLFFASISNQVAFLTSPDVVFLENMSSTFLTNGGRELELVNPDGVTVDRVNYDISWYNDSEKEDGGYSLERINLSEPCRGSDNWTGSEAEFGGTPGEENSVYSEEPDLTAPEIVAVYAQGSNLIEVRFSEVIDSLSVLFTDITILPIIGVDAVFNSSPDYSSLLIQLSEPLEQGIRYELSLEGITDCVGNPIGLSDSFVFALPQTGEPGDLLINEILFNPRTAGRDFVEIYNASDKNIGLENWVLQNADLTTRVISEDPLVIFPGQHLVLTDDINSTIQEYPMSGAYRENFHEMESLPSYNNGDGSVILADSLENEIDRFDYLEDYHFPLLNSFDGVSLERLSYTRPTNEAGNWSSASERVGFATPGYVNSQFLPEGRASAQFELQDEVFSPDNDGFEDVLLINYTLDGPDYLATIRIYDRRGRLIRGLTNNLLLGTDGTLSWDGTTDDRSKAPLGPHIILVEIFSPDGETETFKIPCIVAGNLSN